MKTKEPQLLIIDDDPTIGKLLLYQAQKQGYTAIHAEDSTHGKLLAERHQESIEIILLDLHLPDEHGQKTLETLTKKYPLTPTVILSGAGEISDAVAAMRTGAIDYLTKPFDLDELFQVLQKAREVNKLRRENLDLRETLHNPASAGPLKKGIIGEAPAMKICLEQLEKIAPLDTTILITGESGVGKTLIARSIHENSSRSAGPFVTVSCPTLPHDLLESELFGHEKGAFTGATNRRLGKIELAQGGTLFLDEIGDLPLDLQPKLLTVLQDKIFQRIGGERTISTDIRLITATNHHLEEKVTQGSFREDLYYRLNVVPIHVPPLRDRLTDLPQLSKHILKTLCKRHKLPSTKLSSQALEQLQAHHWPGNVRELEHLLERILVLNQIPEITPEHLPQWSPTLTPEPHTPNLAGKTLQEIEAIALEQTLTMTGGNKAKAARLLGISEKSIYNKLKKVPFRL